MVRFRRRQIARCALAALLGVVAAGCPRPVEEAAAIKSANVSAAAALEAGDAQLPGGDYYDAIPLQVTVGERITADLRSTAFDPYLMLLSPSNRQYENDDHESSREHSHLELVAEESGEWTAIVTTIGEPRVGAYQIEIATAKTATPGQRHEHGALEPGDEVLADGALADRLEFTGQRGDYVWIDLRSREFDPYLILVDPNGEQHENDDFEGSLDRSVLGMLLPADGEYQLLVTSAGQDEQGSWDLTLRRDLEAGPAERLEAGELADGDEALRSGEWVDEYEIEGVVGQQVELRLSSSEFDTYLIYIDPEGRRLESDDDEQGDSSIRTRLRVPGSHRVLVTSYEVGEVGRYLLRLDRGDVQPLPEIPQLQLGNGREGRLEVGDEELPDGELVDRYTFRADAGMPVELIMTSTDLDSYLLVRFPDGTVVTNDDDWDQLERSRLQLTLPLTGVYDVEATSYSPGEIGSYEIELRRVRTLVAPPMPGAPNRTLALLVGISDYGGRAAELDHTADDARNLQRVLVERAGVAPEDSILLIDGEATVERFREALRALASQMSAADQLVLFYSGHGSRLRRAAFQPADPDSVDETLSLYDAELSDDELASLLNDVPGRLVLVLDSCFSGGFAKDVISVPRRIGFFSSEEDVTSSVAEKFRAGGFLSVFLVQALEGGWADNGDGHLTTLELSHYLHERYRESVKGGGPEDFVRTGGPLLGYQRLVVDRGSLAPTDILFRLQPVPDADE